MPHDTPQEPSFSERLSQAISSSGMTLQQISSRLADADLRVSNATLSYWSSGRSLPTRSRSLSVVRELEVVLGVLDGSLVDAIPGAQGAHGFGAFTGRAELLAEAQRTHHLPLSSGWVPRFVHRHVVVGPDGAEKSSRTRMVQSALVNRTQRWTGIFQGDTRQFSARGLVGVEVVRTLELAPNLVVIEFCVSEPLDRGQSVYTEHEFTFGLTGDVADCAEFTVHKPTSVVTLSVAFEADPPSAFHHAVILPGEDDPTPSEHRVVFDGHTAQVAVPDAQPGVHRIAWTW